MWTSVLHTCKRKAYNQTVRLIFVKMLISIVCRTKFYIAVIARQLENKIKENIKENEIGKDGCKNNRVYK